MKLHWNTATQELELAAPYSSTSPCRRILGAVYDKRRKVWTFPVSAISTVKKVFGDRVTYSVEAQQAVDKFIQDYRYVEALKSRKAEPPEHPFLMWHQRVCVEIARRFPRYAWFMDTGTGKTLAALQVIAENTQIKWLVVCPRNIIKTAWMADQQKFFPKLKLLPLSTNIKKEDYLAIAEAWGVKVTPTSSTKVLLQKLLPLADCYIINPESFKQKLAIFQIYKVKGLIFDESVKIKSMKTAITKNILDFAEDLSRVYVMSGLPAPNSPLEYYPQMYIIDRGIFGESYYRFRGVFFEQYGYMNYNWRLRKDMAEKFGQRLGIKSFFVSKDDCLDLPEKTYLVHQIDLPTEIQKYYLQMERQRFLLLEDSVAIARNNLTSIMKLRQITGGFVIDEKDATQPIHEHKLNELLEVLEGIGNKPVIIWCNFRNEIQTIETKLQELGKTVVTAYAETRNIDDSIEAFKTGRAQYIIAHPASLKYGVTFTHCSYAVYYSISYSYDDYYQSHDRIYRKGQNKPCTFIFLLCSDTIDEVIYQALKDKRDMSEAIKVYAKRRRYIG